MRVLIRGLGELCITAGLVLLLFVTYELWGTGRYTHEQQDKLGKEMMRTWASGPSGGKVTTERVKLGKGLAMIRIPKFGSSYHYVVIEGVSLDDLRKGPGHYPGTQLPGEVGNFVVSGHRTTYSAPFNRIGELKPGDEIDVDTRDGKYVYKVTTRRVVDPTDVQVTAPVPFHPGERASKRMITLTTCHPMYSAAERLIVFGELSAQYPRVTGK
ncbi:class E sortase [Actinomadura rupiterrae]|uniref:class E sortase n=1 Tax=Actinomadura rupiterrae TaxID=559627 RepID=UPI0020A4996D|nr:class E sortase [Actinomadura rupiterrae]MCP2340648.1 sortase A [Actinomadura rupiterrae]